MTSVSQDHLTGASFAERDRDSVLVFFARKISESLILAQGRTFEEIILEK